MDPAGDKHEGPRRRRKRKSSSLAKGLTIFHKGKGVEFEMPIRYTREEVKEYLESRGFDVNDEDLIDRFIRDLKKMLKYENRQRRRQRLGHGAQETALESDNDDDIESPSRSRATTRRSGRGSEISKRVSESHEHRSKRKSPRQTVSDSHVAKARGSAAPRHHGPGKRSSIQSSISGTEESGSSNTSPDSEDLFDPDGDAFARNPRAGGPAGSGRPRSRMPSSKSRPDSGKENDPNKTSELIGMLGDLLGSDNDPDTPESYSTGKTLQGPPAYVRRDPVLLYHYYKKCWDKQGGIPGENRHMKLRWNVRAQTVGNYPCIDGRPVKYLR